TWSNQYAAITWHRQCLLFDPNPTDPLDDKIKFFRSNMLMQCVRALERKPPESRAQKLAPSSLKKVGVRNSHHIRRPPSEVFGFNQMITVDCFHDFTERCCSGAARRVRPALTRNAIASLPAMRAVGQGIIPSIFVSGDPIRKLMIFHFFALWGIITVESDIFAELTLSKSKT